MGFPYTSSVYYQCNVKLCIKHAGGCDTVPPICENGVNLIRRKRQVRVIDERENSYDIDEKPHSINVYSGLYVNEAEDLDDDVIVISFIAGLYFKMDKFVKVLTKYSWVRRFCHVCIDMLLAGYYTYTILLRGYAGYRLTLLALCLGAGAANAYVMYKQVCQPGTFKIRNLDEMDPPEDVKIQTAFKIVNMKA